MKKILLSLLFLSALLVAQNNFDASYNEDEEDVATIEDEIFSASTAKYSFSRSKRLLATKVYRQHKKTFYANCDYEIKGKRLVPLPDTCGFEYRKNKARAERIEWEHIVPAWEFGHRLSCWREGGRKKCRESNQYFQQMEADMHNLVPAIGEINGDRSNFPYNTVRGEKRLYGKVDMEIDFANRRAEPKRNILGDIARTYLFMREKYNIPMSQEQEALLIKWNNQDPVSRWEKKKNLLVKNLQGDSNHYISNYQRLTKLNPIKPRADLETTESSTNFNEVHNELSKKYGSLLDKIPQPLATIILIIMTLFVLYRRNKK